MLQICSINVQIYDFYAEIKTNVWLFSQKG